MIRLVSSLKCLAMRRQIFISQHRETLALLIQSEHKAIFCQRPHVFMLMSMYRSHKQGNMSLMGCSVMETVIWDELG